MGQPRLITAQFNRIQCGRRGWLQGPASSCVIPREREMGGGGVFMCVLKKCVDGGEKYNNEKEDFRAFS